MDRLPHRRYPARSLDYKLYEAIGEGMSATVYRALCVPFNEIVAIKVLDLEKCRNGLDDIRREVHMMSLIDHPKVLRALCSFTAGQCLWIVMPYMAAGSCLNIMRSRYPHGFEEPVIATLLHDTLTAIHYLHSHGHIHRDVKSGNILVDSNGSVKLADFGVSACMFETGERQHARNTFVGTPSWMAPEVLKGSDHYDSRVDIWSFGITAIELAHGHAPLSNLPAGKVFMTIIQNPPPRLDYERDKKFSKSFKDMVDCCLKKDPRERPMADKLLKHSFFKGARPREYLARTILKGLQPLGEIVKQLKIVDEEEAGINKALPRNIDPLYQCIKGVSEWNFNLDDLKYQASLIEDSECSTSQENLRYESNSGLSYEDEYSLRSSPPPFTIRSLLLKGSSDIGTSCEESVPSDSDLLSIRNHTTVLPLVIPGYKKVPLENVIEYKGRFKVTAADLSPKGSLSSVSTHGSRNSAIQLPQNMSSASIMSSLQLILHHNDMQMDEIKRLIKCLEQYSEIEMESKNDVFAVSAPSALDGSFIYMQQRMESLTEELHRAKLRCEKLERKLSDLGVKE